MAKVQWGVKLAKAIQEAGAKGVKKTKIREILEISGIAVSIGVGAFTLTKAFTTNQIDEVTLQKAVDELELIDKDLDKKIATTVAKIETLTAERQAEMKKDKYIQFGIIGGLFAILGTLIFFVMSDRKKRRRK